MGGGAQDRTLPEISHTVTFLQGLQERHQADRGREHLGAEGGLVQKEDRALPQRHPDRRARSARHPALAGSDARGAEGGQLAVCVNLPPNAQQPTRRDIELRRQPLRACPQPHEGASQDGKEASGRDEVLDEGGIPGLFRTIC